MAKMLDELNTPLVSLHPDVFNKFIDQFILAVPEPAHCFDLRRIVRVSLGELDVARRKKVANPIEAGLPVHIEPVVSVEIEGAKCFSSLRRTLLKILVEHLFPTLRVEFGGVRYHTVKVKKDGIVLVAAYHTSA